MQITDIISITELSRLLGKSRPTVYKYVSDFESGNERLLPPSVRKLFREITAENMAKRDIYEYCNHWFGNVFSFSSAPTVPTERTTLREIISLLKKHEASLDLSKIKNLIYEEIQR